MHYEKLGTALAGNTANRVYRLQSGLKFYHLSAEPQKTVQPPRGPEKVQLWQNHPNPFNPETRIVFEISASGEASVMMMLKIYNLAGQEVIAMFSGQVVPGQYEVIWNGKNEAGQLLSSGFYIYVLHARRIRHSRKMLLR